MADSVGVHKIFLSGEYERARRGCEAFGFCFFAVPNIPFCMPNRITELLQIRYPIIQAGMVWCSGWRLASACSNNGILGVLGAGSMYPNVLREHIEKMHAATDRPFAVNVPLLYPEMDELIEIILAGKVPVVITSAGNPAKYAGVFKSAGCTLLHVVSSAKFAEKAANAGVDAIICEGFEAGGHNGREETTTLCLVPQVRKAVDLPLVAAGGIATGQAMYAAMALGADGVQIGSRFAVASESSAHEAYKQRVVDAVEGDTVLTLKELAPVRLIKNAFYEQVQAAYLRGASAAELAAILGRARAKRGIFEGDLAEGELEIGQVSALIDHIEPVKAIVAEIVEDFEKTKAVMAEIAFEQ